MREWGGCEVVGMCWHTSVCTWIACNNNYSLLQFDAGFFPLLHNQQKSASYEQKLNRENKVQSRLEEEDKWVEGT